MQYRVDQFTVKTYDCRPDGQIKLNALMQYMQEAAARHAEQLGFGFADLNARDCFWVLVNLRLELTHTPRWREDITIRTWPSGSTKLIASREFVGEGQRGEMFRATSDWMILDRNSGRPKNLSRLDLSLPPAGPKALPEEPNRLQPAKDYETAHSLRVPFSALDFNGHVNNTEYVCWALDGVYRKLGRLPEIRAMQVTYLAEVFEGDDVEILVSTDTGTVIHTLTQRLGDSTGTDVFLMKADCRTSLEAESTSRTTG